MLRSFQKIKHFNQKNAFLVNLNPKNYHYQTEFYTGKFDSVDENLANQLITTNHSRSNQSNLYRYIHAYRQYGYKISQVDPLDHQNNINKISELDPATYGLERNSTAYSVKDLIHASESRNLTIDEIENYLKNIYSNKISIEFDFISSPEEKLWIEKKFEELLLKPIENKTRLNILDILIKSQVNNSN